WTLLLTVLIGNTVFSVTAILTVFMAGLALGSRLSGRTIDQKPVPLIRLYAGLEAAIGLYNLALPWLLKSVDPLFGFAYSTAYQSPLVLSGVRLLICALLLIVPATLMGATLPVLVRYYTERIANAGTQAGRVYSANTLGAALGSYRPRRYTVRLTTLAWAQGLIGLASLALVPAFGRLPLFIAQLVIRHADSFASVQILEFLLTFGLMLVPTTLLGMTFPVASKLYARSDALVGSDVSAVYAVNTAGGIAGSLIAG